MSRAPWGLLGVVLLACDPPPPPVVAPPPPPPTDRRPLPPECLKPLGPLAGELARTLDALTLASLEGWTTEREIALGESLLERSLIALDAGPHPEWQAAAERTLLTLDAGWPEARFPHRVIALDSPNLNATALPGGLAILHSGLLEQKVTDEDQLAFVIAHELAHVELGHAAGLHAFIGALPEAQRAPATELVSLLGHGFSATQELEADRLAVVWMHMSGFATARAADFWRQPWPAPIAASPALALAMPQLERLDSPEGAELLEQLAQGAGVPVEELRAQGIDAAVLPLLASHPPPEARACVCEHAAIWAAQALPR